jgi:TatD DNase family protein
MKLIDTHAHLQFKAYDEDRDLVVKRNSKELKAVINVGAAIDSSEGAVALANKIPNFYASVGVHPHHSDQWDTVSLQKLRDLAKDERAVAIGEIGLDKHPYEGYPPPDLASQSRVLHEQTSLAMENSLPIIFHCRDAYDELYDEIKKLGDRLTGVVHCFMGSWEQAKRFLEFGLFISFTGNLTYKNNDFLREIAKKVSLERILTETDAPYLPPEPYRGKRNEPIYVKIVAAKLADIKDLSIEEITKATTQNAKKLFKI